MRNQQYVAAGAVGGMLTGITTYGLLIAGATSTALAAASGGVSLLASLPFLLGVLPYYHIAKQLNRKYEDSPVELMSYHFLLVASSWTLCSTLCIAISAAFISAINPFTLPILIAAGMSATILLGLYLLSRETPPATASQKQSSFFNCFGLFSSKTKPGLQANETVDIEAYISTHRLGQLEVAST